MKKTIALLIAILIGCGASCFAQGKVINQKVTTKTTKAASQKKSQTVKPTPKPDIGEPDGIVDGHGYVDLGLPSGTKWAYTNFGAVKPTDKGFLYEWGNLVPGDKNNANTKGDITGNPNYDVAAYSWGKNWSIPTESNWKELFACCELTEFFIDSKRFFKVQNSNGKFIILPTTRPVSGDDCAFYWTSTYRDGFDGGRAQDVSIYNPNNIHIDATYISILNLIRPVISTINNVNNTTSEKKISSTSNLVENTDKKNVNGYINGHEYVDLGLPSRLKWATCNVGATSPEEYGDYFAYGETHPKTSYNKEDNLSYGKKISKLESNGIINTNGILNIAYDAAKANWGGSWRMPTKTEMEELTSRCTWNWISEGDHKGFKVIGPNGNSIFLPANGRQGGTMLYGVGEAGNYRSSSVCDGKDGAYSLMFGNMLGKAYTNVSCSYRDGGSSVRPVSE